MPGQEQTRPPHGDPTDDIPPAAPHASTRRSELDADIDAVLDDIDSLLETNAEEFVRGFIQKGGQ
ncbi:prokaryotic ubiquitin-like protein Pup [Austwickia chelonae]|uniref:Prokaryotic ubiquitin-like protein Pup n=1 Tax=Austwickia chelonae NBRC 105200 TaxID=1184607 RepID=K6VP57_9MICO|nr:ubiquitin-like protein Pup [Austwickia chelonae]GAB77155.1 hypothetical protein AUCHE_05_00600 [Austwickia chelonae NBRC 105200]SEW04032.1 prokaryotic ubiquitin-like protein Pup [Austwickia chelonae]